MAEYDRAYHDVARRSTARIDRAHFDADRFTDSPRPILANDPRENEDPARADGRRGRGGHRLAIEVHHSRVDLQDAGYRPQCGDRNADTRATVAVERVDTGEPIGRHRVGSAHPPGPTA